jgi:hypothetical protein
MGPRSRLLLKLDTIEGDKEGYRGVTVAYITLSILFSSLSRTNDKAKIATSIGGYLENEARFHFVASTQPAMWSRLVRYAKEHGSYRHQVRFINNTLTKEGVCVEEWSIEDKTLLGNWLIGLVEEAGLIESRAPRGPVHARARSSWPTTSSRGWRSTERKRTPGRCR